MKKHILEELLKHDINITPGALELIEKKYSNSLKRIIEEAIKRNIAIITEDFLRNFDNNKVEVIIKETYKRLADEYEEEIEVKKSFKKISSKADVKKFLNYFRNRYEKIKEMFIKRGIKPVTISQAIKSKEEVYIVCCVYDVRETSSKNIVMDVDDPTGSVKALVLKDELKEVCKEIIRDEIICLKGRYNKSFFIVSDIIFPDSPLKTKTKKLDIPIVTVFISDIHLGSKKFLKEKFLKFIRWLNLEGNRKEIASKVKYIIIGGDLVDGIGVYPNHEEELEIKNIRRQYKELYEILSKLPKNIRVIIIPGNHDATRQAEPQPPIIEEYAKEFYEDSRFLMLSNPSYISLHGIDILIYHGRSLDDIITTLPGYDYKKVDKAMSLWLKKRHLSPLYGSRTPIAPEDYDFLLIDNIPDIIHAGHVHRTAVSDYKNVLLINSGTFQEQTEFQKRMNIVPTPGLVPILYMDEMRVSILEF